MEDVDLNEGLEIALDAIHADRFAMICGAGLSMADPSSIPSAWAVAREAKNAYDAIYGATRDPLSENIEEQAEYFFDRGQLSTTYLRKLVSGHTFSAPPNKGHRAIADFLLTSASRLAVTTNVDSLIENAGDHLYGNVASGTSRDAVAAVVPDQSPLLKIHGCWKANLDETVWAPSQLSKEPLKTRIEECADWLRTNLLNRDLLIVGYFTDWDYLNKVLEKSLEAVTPSNVIVVDPSDKDDLEDKAPALFAVGEKSAGRFVHVSASGDHFLDELRRRWSLSFYRRVLRSGHDELTALNDPRADITLCEPPDLDTETLWKIRRDLEGGGPKDPCKLREPPSQPAVGYTHLILRSAGAIPDGAYWRLSDKTIRVLNAGAQTLHKIQAVHGNSLSSAESPDLTIAVGAIDLGLKQSVSREPGQSTIVRTKADGFVTLDTAKTELSI